MARVEEKTQVGNYFIANYPPFSFWKPEYVPDALETIARPPRQAVPLGLYLHIPFCRRRCKFCYYRVYTDKTAADVQRYLTALARELALYAASPVCRDRSVEVVYFGGGTPSFPSIRQLEQLFAALDRLFPWKQAREITFECEPGTLTEAKVRALRSLGVTRLSLGVEHFNDAILAENGRAHLSAEIRRCWQWIRQADFPEVNIDLIAGMVGETWESWRDCVREAIALEPDCVTIYQMELPYNTLYSQSILRDGAPVPVADWPTKRAWVEYAFEQFERRGYTVTSCTTVVRDPERFRFRYREALFTGADLIGTGVASFGHLQGVHMQNEDRWDSYLAALDEDRLPLRRALRPTRRQLFIREFVLQLKLGGIRREYFREKFGMDPVVEFDDVIREYVEQGYVKVTDDELLMTRQGLLRVDALLPEFFEPEHRGARYT